MGFLDSKMRNAAVFFCYKELSDIELLAFQYSLINLRNNFELYCITKNDLYQYVERNLSNEFSKIYVADKPLSSLQSYTRYLKSIEFYKLFEDFDYLQIWQDDAVVLRPLTKIEPYYSVSYVGAPITKTINNEPFTYVGNGGLSLRNVRDHLTVLRSLLQLKEPKWFTRSSAKNRIIFEIYKKFPFARNTWINYNEDFFWTCINNHPSYKVSNVELALQYAWETNLASQKLADSKILPFGCHAWEKFSCIENKAFILERIS